MYSISSSSGRARAVNETFHGLAYITGSSIVISLTIVAESLRV
jgi:hypothetical protein